MPRSRLPACLWLCLAASAVAPAAHALPQPPAAHAGEAAPEASPPADREAFARIRGSIEAEVASGRLAGVGIALVKDGRVAWEAGFGHADRAAGRHATAHTPFSIASTTKPITTTALMTLVAAGRLRLDAPANDLLGDARIVDARGPAQAVTLRRLATHTSGLPTFFAMYPEGGTARQPGMDALIRDYGRLVAPVGERYEYSNLAYGILAHVVARASGQEYGRYLREHVFDPLGMHDSFFDTEPGRRDRMAVRYGDDGQPLPFYLTATPGSGEVYASAHDLARFALLHLGRAPRDAARILDDARLDELHRPAVAMAPTQWYAMGWQVLRAPGRAEALYHGGGQSGVDTEFVLVPSAGAAVVVLGNQRDREFLAALRDRLLAVAVPGWQGLPPPPAPSLEPLRPLHDYVGIWRGTLLAQGREVATVLRVAHDGAATLALGEAPARPVADFGLIDGLLSGETEGRVGSPDTEREHVGQLSLNLKRRGERLDGEIIAWRKASWNMTILPYRVDLRREPAGVSSR
ncbi:MAG TPA: serine hydrolase domain-containing protein [Luteimonas sp.]|nr:serine hydrolase domain-containing protein [Luteimonas sp.]